jgi:hypothetical protein
MWALSSAFDDGIIIIIIIPINLFIHIIIRRNTEQVDVAVTVRLIFGRWLTRLTLFVVFLSPSRKVPGK